MVLMVMQLDLRVKYLAQDAIWLSKVDRECLLVLIQTLQLLCPLLVRTAAQARMDNGKNEVWIETVTQLKMTLYLTSRPMKTN